METAMTYEAFKSSRACEEISLYVHDALMQPQRCGLLVCGDEAFVDAMAPCCAEVLATSDFNLLDTTSFGVGECISHALAHRCSRITVRLGNPCTNDGGMGCLRALGMRFFDQEGNELSGCGADLVRVARIDESGLYAPVHTAEITVVDAGSAPLLGPQGATYAFAPQKGAGEKTSDRLEAGMRAFADVVVHTHPAVDFDTPGYGAAGGLGMALSVFLGARI